jgi:tRNA threonylcarbamoyladenosine biosynthesis protein TsaE
MKSLQTYSLKETYSVASSVLQSLEAGVQATVLALYGDLGSGKTSFVQGIAFGLGITEIVQSPTFVLMKQYEIAGHVWDQLIHIDAYRMNIPRDLELLEWSRILENPKNLICIEWPELYREHLPGYTKDVHCRFVNDSTREISF